MQAVVGGYLEHVAFGSRIGLLVDEDGRIKGCLPNFDLEPGMDIVGPALFVGEKGENFVSLSADQIAGIRTFFDSYGNGGMDRVSEEERKKLTSKGRKWLREYLNGITDSGLSEKCRQHLFRVICDMYREYMETDRCFEARVLSFASGRRSASEKKTFFFKVVRFLVSMGGIKELYSERYPDEYRFY